MRKQFRFNVSQPCSDCPFREDVPPFLHPAPARDIVEALVLQGLPFVCHETVDYDVEPDERVTADTKHCAGAVYMLLSMNCPNTSIQIAERLGIFNTQDVPPPRVPVFSSAAAFVAHHDQSQPVRQPTFIVCRSTNQDSTADMMRTAFLDYWQQYQSLPRSMRVHESHLDEARAWASDSRLGTVVPIYGYDQAARYEVWVEVCEWHKEGTIKLKRP